MTKSEAEDDGNDSIGPDDELGVDKGSGGGPGEGDGSNSGEKGHDGSGPGDGDGPSDDGESRQPKMHNVKAGKYRFACTDESNGEYVMFIVPAVNEPNGVLELNAVAELNTYEASIISARSENGNELKVDGNKISGLEFKEGVQEQVFIKLDYSDYVSLEVMWHGIDR